MAILQKIAILARVSGLLVPLLAFGSVANGQAYKEDIGYNRLLSEVGPGLANGAGVSVAIVEAEVEDPKTPANQFYPNTLEPEFSGKTFTDGSSLPMTTVSSHATDVSRRFFGNASSLAGGVTNVTVYEANNFVTSQQQLQTFSLPGPLLHEVVNHSYVAASTIGSPALDSQSNARLDFTVERDNITSVVAANNGNTTNSLPTLYMQSYNSISVGLTSGDHSAGFTNINGSMRIKPDIVAPEAFTSYATPLVSSSAALLHQAATNFGTTNAKNSEAMKAIIMAGATKDEFVAWDNAQNVSRVTTQPLDTRYGAGELNVYNSYRILEAGESNGSALPPGISGLRGWDYGNLAAGGSSLFWNFQVDPGQIISEASVLLTWNAKYSNLLLNSPGTLSLANLDLRLYDSTMGFLGTQVAASLSTVDNVEHLYLKNLASGLYTIAVTGDAATDFGLAWNITAVPEPGVLVLLGVPAVGLIAARLRKTQKRSS
jgi:hypothetical protein